MPKTSKHKGGCVWCMNWSIIKSSLSNIRCNFSPLKPALSFSRVRMKPSQIIPSCWVNHIYRHLSAGPYSVLLRPLRELACSHNGTPYLVIMVIHGESKSYLLVYTVHT